MEGYTVIFGFWIMDLKWRIVEVNHDSGLKEYS